MKKFFEELFFNTKSKHLPIILLLFPFSILYGVINYLKTLFIKPKDFGIKIISIGNLIVGGSGKTPFAISLINYIKIKYPNIKIFYISRGYGRYSKGLVEVKKGNKILINVRDSGDEAMLVANECDCDVIVSEDRVKAILKAKENNANLIILDDAFSKIKIKKFDILLMPKIIKNPLPLPAGGFREFLFAKKRANLILKEDIDYKREVTLDNYDKKDRLLLVTAISNPNRLNKYLPKNIVGKYILSDHAYFEKKKILINIHRFNANKIITTQKDWVKIKNFKLPMALLKLKLQINLEILDKIERFINEK